MPAAARHQWARLCCPSQDHRARTPLLVVAAPTPRWQASGLCFATTEWPLRGQQALRQPRNCTAVGLSAARALARRAEAAHEACRSLCMSHWRARGGKKTLRASAKTRDLLRRSTNTTLRTRSADQQRGSHAVCTAEIDCVRPRCDRPGSKRCRTRCETVFSSRRLPIKAHQRWEKAREKAPTAPQ